MPELSTLLRQRLVATENPGSQHPDSNVLNAYVEELLPSPERAEVLAHLSRCAQCREVVALAAPERVPEQQLLPAPVSRLRRRWFLSPAFGLAGSLAAMVLGAVLILRLPQTTRQSETSNTTQKLQIAQAVATPAPDTANEPAAQPSGPVSSLVTPQPAAHSASEPKAESSTRIAELSDMTSLRRADMARARKEAAAAPELAAELRKQDYLNRGFLANSYEGRAVAPVLQELPQAPAPVQSSLFLAPPSVVAGSSFQASGSFEVSSTISGTNQGVVSFYSAESQVGRETTLMGKIVDFGKRPLVRRLGAPIPSSSVGTSAMFKPGLAAAQPLDASSDRGEGGVLAQSHAFSSNALATIPRRQMLGIPQYQWKVVQGKLLRSTDQSHWAEENPAGENVQFSSVIANGADVWAGGSQAALLHSADSGTTWERVILGTSAAGNINSIEIAGQTVRVKSSSGQSWISRDSGKSWMLLE